MTTAMVISLKRPTPTIKTIRTKATTISKTISSSSSNMGEPIQSININSPLAEVIMMNREESSTIGMYFADNSKWLL